MKKLVLLTIVFMGMQFDVQVTQARMTAEGAKRLQLQIDDLEKRVSSLLEVLDSGSVDQACIASLTAELESAQEELNQLRELQIRA